MPPENGGAPWGRAVPFEDESKRNLSAERVPGLRNDRASEAQALQGQTVVRKVQR